MKLLVVEDEALLRHHLYTRLGEQGHVVDAVGNAEEALYRAHEYHHDLAIIDLGLPGMSGLDLIREFRSQGKAFPILILTARGNWQDKVEGLAAGADDYVVKPFQFEELEARLNALLRRSSGFVQATIEAGPLLLDLNRKQATVAGETLGLTAFEYRILEYLMRHHQQVVSKERLIEQLYPDDDERDPNVIEVLVGRLRRKLESHEGFRPIDTVRGQGYLFTERCR
ncbi:two-component system, OmpR family, response regulator PhoP [Pseudomonas citronellolis]|jgi:two-component system response regulator PhoP|uniref:Two-component system, OmpR family, response regulator PhoP n=1 Tax=Pseudomonas citronellolis TaxID=53408 RepID=A0AAQ1HN11_9PSED|nr:MULTISPECIES: response regulator [Pseudomonas]MBB1608415.1 DNA-binding response regulator [Pseudomonas sp. UMC76]MBB1638557.1 DNA-binding response regulator [Pseudomonas sp. UME83]MCP1646385.1 two-component system response regulator PhoP [Pseudomonas citronellolis]MCP1669337.1 two-component system response regulator PhoP [Pseudomonas citronellolis]MCP1701038.1 two-component system response regulator PhoP [Pseudomonas citronellolis]